MFFSTIILKLTDNKWYQLILTDTIWPMPPCINATISIMKSLQYRQYNFPKMRVGGVKGRLKFFQKFGFVAGSFPKFKWRPTSTDAWIWCLIETFKLKFGPALKAEFFQRLWSWSIAKGLKVKFGWHTEAEFLSSFWGWSLVEILELKGTNQTLIISSSLLGKSIKLKATQGDRC